MKISIFILLLSMTVLNGTPAFAQDTAPKVSKKIDCKNDAAGTPTCLIDTYFLDDVTLALMTSDSSNEAHALFNRIMEFDKFNTKSERGFAETRKTTLLMSLDVFGPVKGNDMLDQRKKDVSNHTSFILPISQLARTTVNEVVPGKPETRLLSFKPTLDADRIDIGKTFANVCSKRILNEGFNCIRIRNLSLQQPQNLPDNVAKKYLTDLPLSRFDLRAHRQVMRPLNKTELVLENSEKLVFAVLIQIDGKVKQEGSNTVIEAIAKKAVIYGPRGAIVGHDLASE